MRVNSLKKCYERVDNLNIDLFNFLPLVRNVRKVTSLDLSRNQSISTDLAIFASVLKRFTHPSTYLPPSIDWNPQGCKQDNTFITCKNTNVNRYLQRSIYPTVNGILNIHPNSLPSTYMRSSLLHSFVSLTDGCSIYWVVVNEALCQLIIGML